jgi:formate--tetrahydrofolate ligase
MYGASETRFTEEAQEGINMIEAAGLGNLPVCMAKTHLSLSNNSAKKGRPRGFKLEIEGVDVMAGAGYVVVRCEGVNLMPGLPKRPRGEGVDIDPKTFETKGLL